VFNRLGVPGGCRYLGAPWLFAYAQSFLDAPVAWGVLFVVVDHSFHFSVMESSDCLASFRFPFFRVFWAGVNSSGRKL